MSKPTYKIYYGEQKTDEWHKLREGVAITGSNAKKVKGTGDAFLYETLATMLTKRVKKEVHNEHVDRGNELEPEARKTYEKETKNKVLEVAFIENGRYGISPDGIVFKEKEFNGKVKKLIEIKCPDTNNHIRYILENKIPAEHKDQIIHGFVVVDDCDEIDFISYCPMFAFKPLHIITVKRNNLIMEISTARIAYEKFTQKLDKYYSILIS